MESTSQRQYILTVSCPDGVGLVAAVSGLIASRSGVQISIDNREEQVTETIPSAGTVLSAFDGETIYERAIMELRAGDILLLYTDGAVEALRPVPTRSTRL